MQLVVSLTFKSTATLLSFLTLLAGIIVIIIVITYKRDERASVNFVMMDMWYSIGRFTYLQEHGHPSFLSYSSCWYHRHHRRHHLRERRTSICYYCVDGHVRYAIGCFTYLQEHGHPSFLSYSSCWCHRHHRRHHLRERRTSIC